MQALRGMLVKATQRLKGVEPFIYKDKGEEHKISVREQRGHGGENRSSNQSRSTEENTIFLFQGNFVCFVLVYRCFLYPGLPQGIGNSFLKGDRGQLARPTLVSSPLTSISFSSLLTYSHRPALELYLVNITVLPQSPYFNSQHCLPGCSPR